MKNCKRCKQLFEPIQRDSICIDCRKVQFGLNQEKANIKAKIHQANRFLIVKGQIKEQLKDSLVKINVKIKELLDRKKE